MEYPEVGRLICPMQSKLGKNWALIHDKQEVHEESDEQIVVDIADEALEQIRYRLEVAKIDPS